MQRSSNVGFEIYRQVYEHWVRFGKQMDLTATQFGLTNEHATSMCQTYALALERTRAKRRKWNKSRRTQKSDTVPLEVKDETPEEG